METYSFRFNICFQDEVSGEFKHLCDKKVQHGKRLIYMNEAAGDLVSLENVINS